MAAKKKRKIGKLIKKLSGAAASKKEIQRIRSLVDTTNKKKLPPRAPGSERSFAFTSVDSSGKKVTRFSDKPTPRRGEKRKRFR